jgi:hypothetical protein
VLDARQEAAAAELAGIMADLAAQHPQQEGGAADMVGAEPAGADAEAAGLAGRVAALETEIAALDGGAKRPALKAAAAAEEEGESDDDAELHIDSGGESEEESEEESESEEEGVDEEAAEQPDIAQVRAAASPLPCHCRLPHAPSPFGPQAARAGQPTPSRLPSSPSL